MERVKQEKSESETKIQTLELEVCDLREQAIRQNQGIDDGGATIVLPLQNDSVLQPLRDQQGMSSSKPSFSFYFSQYLSGKIFNFVFFIAPPKKLQYFIFKSSCLLAALGQLGGLLNVFSFGFGDEGASSSVGDRMTKVFSGFNPFASGDDPKPLQSTPIEDEKGVFGKLKLW
jgi:hypothetical protein